MTINVNFFENPTGFDFSGYYQYKRYHWQNGSYVWPYDRLTLDNIYHLRQPRDPSLDDVVNEDGTLGQFHSGNEVPEGTLLPGRCGIDELLIYIGHRFYKWLRDNHYRAVPAWIQDDDAISHLWRDGTGANQVRLETGDRLQFRTYLNSFGHPFDFPEFTGPIGNETDATNAERRFQALKAFVGGLMRRDRPGHPGDMYILFVQWLVQNYKYSGENILYSPAFPDIVYSLETNRRGGNDSPAVRIPPIISYLIRKRMPESMDGVPFGPKKDYKWNYVGDFRDANGELRSVRFRRWENLIEFTAIWNSGLQADILCGIFEQFLEANEGWFLKAGMSKMLPYGRVAEQEPRLSAAGVTYRKTLWYIRTQEFQVTAPTVGITSVDLDVLPAGMVSEGLDETETRIMDIGLSGVPSFSGGIA